MPRLQAKKTSNCKPDSNQILLLSPFCGAYYSPINWEYGIHAKNYFAKIGQDSKLLFSRTFVRGKYIDDRIVFSEKDFPEGEIFEQKCTFVKGSKSEITFQGFFIIHHLDGGIYGQQITQKQCLEYFLTRDDLPDVPSENNDSKNKIRIKLSSTVQSLATRYGNAAVVEILTDLLGQFLTSPEA
jgi:hypothetical protein